MFWQNDDSYRVFTQFELSGFFKRWSLYRSGFSWNQRITSWIYLNFTWSEPSFWNTRELFQTFRGSSKIKMFEGRTSSHPNKLQLKPFKKQISINCAWLILLCHFPSFKFMGFFLCIQFSSNFPIIHSISDDNKSTSPTPIRV